VPANSILLHMAHNKIDLLPYLLNLRIWHVVVADSSSCEQVILLSTLLLIANGLSARQKRCVQLLFSNA